MKKNEEKRVDFGERCFLFKREEQNERIDFVSNRTETRDDDDFSS